MTADARATELLISVIERHLGWRADAIPQPLVNRLAEQELRQASSMDALCAAAEAPDDLFLQRLEQQLVVGETFFFRQPEHFRFISERAADLASHGRKVIRAWSAGCSTGEEAYSLSAVLLQAVEGFRDVRVEVVGTDVSRAALISAEAGVYGRWSTRPGAPLLAPVFTQPSSNRTSVLQQVRAPVRFFDHSLLRPLPAELGLFDFILCRNVLIYLTAEAGGAAVQHLCGALAPGGFILLAPLDLPTPPAGLRLVSAPALQVYTREKQLALKAQVQRMQTPTPAPRLEFAEHESEAIALHLQALGVLDRNDVEGAIRSLTRVVARFPDYIPALLELALCHLRRGARLRAEPLMRALARRVEAMPPDAVVPGPEPLPVRYYARSVAAFLSPSDAYDR